MQNHMIPIMAPHKSGMFCCLLPFLNIQSWVYFFSNVLFKCTNLFLHCCLSSYHWCKGSVMVTVHSRKAKPADNTCHQQEEELSCLLLKPKYGKKEQVQCFREPVCGSLDLKESLGGQMSQWKTFKVLLLFLNNNKTHNKISTIWRKKKIKHTP